MGLSGDGGKHCFLGVEAVLGFLKDGAGLAFEHLFGDLLAAVGGEAVKNDVFGCGPGEELSVDLIGPKGGFLLGLIFLAHREPGIGIDHRSAVDGIDGISDDVDIAGIEFLKELRGGGVGGGAGDGEIEAEILSRPHPGDGHVRKSVAHPSDFLSFPAAEFFADGEQVGEDLAGVLVVREGIDGGDAGVAGEIDNILLGEGADYGAVDHSPEYSGGVHDGFPAAELDIVFGKEHW